MNNSDINDVVRGEWLNDDHIEYFHTLLKRVSDFQPRETWRVQCPDTIQPVSQNHRHIQILHSCDDVLTNRNGHWVCSYYDKTNIIIYDSLNSKKLHSKHKIFLEKLYPFYPIEKKRIIFPTVQNQPNNSDCGVFAIAFAISLFFNIRPEDVVYDHKIMRQHLIQIYKSNEINHFPTVSDKSDVHNFGKKMCNSQITNFYTKVAAKGEERLKNKKQTDNKENNNRKRSCHVKTENECVQYQKCYNNHNHTDEINRKKSNYKINKEIERCPLSELEQNNMIENDRFIKRTDFPIVQMSGKSKDKQQRITLPLLSVKSDIYNSDNCEQQICNSVTVNSYERPDTKCKDRNSTTKQITSKNDKNENYSQYQKSYYNQNRDKIKVKSLNHYKKNRDEINLQRRNNYNKNKIQRNALPGIENNNNICNNKQKDFPKKRKCSVSVQQDNNNAVEIIKKTRGAHSLVNVRNNFQETDRSTKADMKVVHFESTSVISHIEENEFFNFDSGNKSACKKNDQNCYEIAEEGFNINDTTESAFMQAEPMNTEDDVRNSKKIQILKDAKESYIENLSKLLNASSLVESRLEAERIVKWCFHIRQKHRLNITCCKILKRL